MARAFSRDLKDLDLFFSAVLLSAGTFIGGAFMLSAVNDAAHDYSTYERIRQDFITGAVLFGTCGVLLASWLIRAVVNAVRERRRGRNEQAQA